jgi:hypothetical protein
VGWVGMIFKWGAMDLSQREEKVEVSYKVISEAMGVLTVAFFLDEELVHVISGKKELMISKINEIFK